MDGAPLLALLLSLWVAPWPACRTAVPTASTVASVASGCAWGTLSTLSSLRSSVDKGASLCGLEVPPRALGCTFASSPTFFAALPATVALISGIFGAAAPVWVPTAMPPAMAASFAGGRQQSPEEWSRPPSSGATPVKSALWYFPRFGTLLRRGVAPESPVYHAGRAVLHLESGAVPWLRLQKLARPVWAT